MKKIIIIVCLLMATTAMAQTNTNNPKDLWTPDIDVTLGDNWRQKIINVPGKGTPNVVDFFRAFAKAYPCEYHNLLTLAIDGDKEVLFRHSKPYIEIDKDSCFLENESFSMRVFYENDKPAALGVCCHKAITTELQEAYYYRYNNATRKLTPLVMGSDFTGGILKRKTEFFPDKRDNEILMSHNWGRCRVDKLLEWMENNFIIKEEENNLLRLYRKNDVEALLDMFLRTYEMELRLPQTAEDMTNENGDTLIGRSYNALPICVAIQDEHSGKHYAAASAMEGFYYFYARGWERNDNTMLVAVYTECAPQFDYDFGHKNEDGSTVKTPHKLKAGDEVNLKFYFCQGENAVYIDPESESFATIVGKDMPNLKQNEWRCVITHDNEDLVFVSEVDGQTKVFKWDGNLLKEQ